MQYCTKCVYPASTVNISFNDEGVCSSCETFREFDEINEIDWNIKLEKLSKIIRDSKSSDNDSNYDCLIPVSGGKDSYYQTYIITKKLGLKPLLMTYHGNNFLPEGDANRDLMRHKFDCDHIVWGPSINVLKKLNRICFKRMGDMNWQNHCGIFSAPIQVAVKFKIPIIIWGEVNWDISGMFDPDDEVEFSARVRHEHDLRGYEWYDFLNDKEDVLHEKDLLWAKYPSDKEILDVGVRGLYLGNFVKWDPNAHTQLMIDKFNWKPAMKPFERTYRLMSNLDDRYENGIHDLLKFIKFGYGRCSDHASKDIRTGYLSRKEAIKLVKKHDHVISSDLYYWLEYVDMKEEEFWKIADTFREPSVWSIIKNEWVKDNVWGKKCSYGKVYLDENGKKRFKEKGGSIKN